jgi:hypothetical protein
VFPIVRIVFQSGDELYLSQMDRSSAIFGNLCDLYESGRCARDWLQQSRTTTTDSRARVVGDPMKIAAAVAE